jgi:hypothetical protein
MHDSAANLVNRVIPHVLVRQWVLSLPRWARFLLARDPMLITGPGPRRHPPGWLETTAARLLRCQ